jgi:hypothetical protein
LDAIRNQETQDWHIDVLNKQKNNEWDDNSVILSTHNKKVDDINDEKLSLLNSKERNFKSKTI